MSRLTVPFIGGKHTDRSLQVNGQRSVNWHPSAEGDSAKGVLTLLPTPGLTTIGATGDGPCRSNFRRFQNSAYFVSGGTLIRMTTGEAFSTVGTITTSSGRCYLAAGRNYLMVVDGVNGYTWDGTTFATITDPQFPVNPIYCGFIDGYFLMLDANSEQWQISAIEDPTAWDALDFASAEADPDDAVAIATTTRDAYFIGTTTTQVYYNSGNPDFPFELYANGVLELGTNAPGSVASVGGSIFLLAQVEGGSTTILRLSGFQAQRIADPDIAYTIGRLAVTSDAQAFAYTEDDQTFYEITFPTANLTLVFHVEQGMWHERQSHGVGRHRVIGHGRFNNKHYVGDYSNNKIYALDTTNYTEDGAPILRKRIMGAVHREQREIEVNSFEIEFSRGVGLTTGQGSDPQAMLRTSWDGGRTWSNEMWRPLGQIGDFTRRAIWNRLGQGADFRAELSISDPVEAIVVSAYADMDVLSA